MLSYLMSYIFPKKSFVEILESKGGYCFFPFKINKLTSAEKLKDFLIEGGVGSLDNVVWSQENVNIISIQPLKPAVEKSNLLQVKELKDAVYDVGKKILQSFKAEANPVDAIRFRNKGQRSDYFFHTDKVSTNNDKKIGLVFSYELLQGKGTCFQKGQEIVSPGPGEAALFLAEDQTKNIAGTIHSAPISNKNRLALILVFMVNEKILNSPLMIEWVESIENNKAIELPNINNEVEINFEYNYLIAGFIVGEIVKPGIKCINSKLNGYNEDKFCIKHYQEAAANWFSIKAITENVVGGFVFGATVYLGGSVVNALTFQKISIDITEAMIDGKNFEELSNLSLQEYSKETLLYIGNAAFSMFINYYFFPVANEHIDGLKIFANAVDCVIAPSILNLAGTALYHGVAMLGNVVMLGDEAYKSTDGFFVALDP